MWQGNGLEMFNFKSCGRFILRGICAWIVSSTFFSPPVTPPGSQRLPAALQALMIHSLGQDGGYNGRLALERVEAAAYDLIWCDWRMPELDGLGFFQVLQPLFRSEPSATFAQPL